MPPSLARRTIIDIESALADKKTTAISEIIQIIQNLASKAFSISISELSDLIGRDPTVTAKVISAANTLGYNPSVQPVSTISDAIHTVGFEKIRNLAITLMLAENASHGANSYEQRQAAARCICSGMLAKQLSQSPGKGEESELLFVCASLRNYGRLLLSTFKLEEYRLARSHALDMTEDQAFELVFGITPLSLGEAILKQTNLPKSIMAALQKLSKETKSRPPYSSQDEALILSELAVSLTSVVFDGNVSPENFNHALSSVLSEFAASYPLSIEAVNEALLQVDQNISDLNRAVGISEKNSPTSVKLRARLNSAHLPDPPDHAKIQAQLKNKPLLEMSEAERTTYSNETFAAAEKKIEAALVPGSKVKLDEMFNEVCTAFSEAANLENCLVFTREEFDPKNLSARYGSGGLFGKVKNRPIFGPDKQDIFSICLARKEDILIQDTNAGKISKVIPEWIHAAGETSSLIILPVNFDKQLRSIIVGTVSNGRQIDLSETDLKHLRSIRSSISLLYGLIDSQTVIAV
ncbi:HDOD domain-containing protein [Pelagicoccus sp. SDUM812002]|uniref:HDOD domain-containing protein n=1 Tax=Pelagicoccus sp. SDUM812002 TaxID=3041266 RepID=UPI0028109995|nr:HDOD domain-containing protein [Pelagicoccus sp. SDUM812002]MDQ8186230.1 HDOD domain-containing protein [Pelagicoccus sp. SDUM812002]